MGLYAAVVTNGSRFLYFSKRANKTVATNSAPVYVTRLNDGNVFTQYNICRNRHRKLFVVLHAVGGIYIEMQDKPVKYKSPLCPNFF